MRIQSTLVVNGDRLAYCTGEDIPSNFECKRISVNGKEYSVSKCGSAMAFCGKMNALLQLALRDEERMPMGEFEIID